MCSIIKPKLLTIHLLYYLHHTFVIVVHIIWETKKFPLKVLIQVMHLIFIRWRVHGGILDEEG